MIATLPFHLALTSACILATLPPHVVADRGEHNYFRGSGYDDGGNYEEDGDGDVAEDYGYYTNVEFQNISCSSDSCPLDWGGQGVFVCRTRYNEYTGASNQGVDCIMSNHSLANDTCGCCGGSCPIPCSKCACTLPVESDHEDFFSSVTVAPRAGVYVLISGHSSPICVPQSASMMMVYNSNGRVTCYTSCEQLQVE